MSSSSQFLVILVIVAMVSLSYYYKDILLESELEGKGTGKDPSDVKVILTWYRERNGENVAFKKRQVQQLKANSARQRKLQMSHDLLTDNPQFYLNPTIKFKLYRPTLIWNYYSIPILNMSLNFIPLQTKVYFIVAHLSILIHLSSHHCF